METITLDLSLDLIHRLYGLAIAWNTTIDMVVNNILREYIEEEKEKGNELG